MTNELLLKQIEKLIAPLKAGQNEIFEEINSIDGRLLFLETAYRSLLHQYESVETYQRLQDKNISKIQKDLSKASSILDIMARGYDERIVQCLRDIDKIKDRLGLPS